MSQYNCPNCDKKLTDEDYNALVCLLCGEELEENDSTLLTRRYK